MSRKQKSLLLFIFFSLFFSGCGLKTKKSVQERKGIAGVELDGTFQEETQVRTRVIEGAGSTTSFGPAIGDSAVNVNLQNENQNFVIGLSLGPGLYRSFLHLNVLRAIERQNIVPNIITGSGMGAVIASLYAFSLTPDLIEWRVFNFLSQVDHIEPYSQAWMEKLESVLLKGFENQNIEDASKVLRLPIFNTKTNKVEMRLRGSLKELIRAQFAVVSGRNSEFIAPYIRHVFHSEELKKGGVDFVLAIDPLGPSVFLKKPDDYWSGVWGRTISLAAREKSGIDAMLTLPTQAMPLDDSSRVDSFLEKTLPSISDSVSRLKIVLENWKKPTNKSLINNQQWYEFDQDFFMGENDNDQATKIEN